MVDGNHCAQTCGRWPCVTAAATPAGDGGVPAGCRDVPPPGSDFSCSQQVWMDGGKKSKH
jgi:hypothetical protein